ncbi:LytR C-terminal domain-containing protein [Cellulomonas chengniuliangii]|uniref:LytR C-terminal domain-containing protein n=1 Tax=Cellulomonas chengniuliangii TaxID=2968084 RepID=A0ABY5L0H2_9CELL|nr:LytR C-terminal domain-containing protein [Cellulomonas chengniuliangii]MCC2307310.1 LytR C-terminal domain-containing protein [Cellulomonas chengniuliangii]MCC2317794.1 LytR C-terminal domain-containing protein [Cellulomonas chengniuliangii]UUI75899.1 LytR C-terminal domain-containing protein [Cellulomonas chengniuliangii]
MTKGRYPYPDDEFDVVDGSVGPRGVHRAPRSRWSRVWPFLLVLVLFPALAYGVVTFLYSWDGNSAPSASQEQVGEPVDDEGAADEGAADDGTAQDGAADEAGDGAAADEEPAQQEPELPAAPVVDKSTAVRVLNAAKVSGLAGKTATKLTTAGFASVDSDNYTGAATTVSGVYYATEDQAATAADIATTLGISKVELSPAQSPSGITVVVAKDYRS